MIAHDRRGHGRSSQVGDGHDIDHYADDLSSGDGALDLKNAIHIGYSTGGGEVVHYLARHRESRWQGSTYQCGAAVNAKDRGKSNWLLPKEVFDGLQAQLAAIARILSLDCREGLSMASTARARKIGRRSSKTGGVRA